MRKFGLLGGTSWLSTIDYYRGLNKLVNQRYSSNVNPPLYIANLNQAEIHRFQRQGDWDSIGKLFIEKSKELELVGCEGLAFCANTPHRVHEFVQEEVEIPILHIGKAVGKTIQSRDDDRVALLGTRYTMEGSFIKGVLDKKFSIDVVIPELADREKIQELLYNEISHGVFTRQAREYFLSLIDELKSCGAQSVILGCTEFPILLDGVEASLPTIDSTACHIKEISEFVISDENLL